MAHAPLDAGRARERPLLASNQAGLVNNLNDGLAWGLFPLYFAAAGLPVREIGWLAALYPAVWGIAQIGTGALADRVGRRPLVAGGMLARRVVDPAPRRASTSPHPYAAGAVTARGLIRLRGQTASSAVGDWKPSTE